MLRAYKCSCFLQAVSITKRKNKVRDSWDYTCSVPIPKGLIQENTASPYRTVRQGGKRLGISLQEFSHKCKIRGKGIWLPYPQAPTNTTGKEIQTIVLGCFFGISLIGNNDKISSVKMKLGTGEYSLFKISLILGNQELGLEYLSHNLRCICVQVCWWSGRNWKPLTSCFWVLESHLQLGAIELHGCNQSLWLPDGTVLFLVLHLK